MAPTRSPCIPKFRYKLPKSQDAPGWKSTQGTQAGCLHWTEEKLVTFQQDVWRMLFHSGSLREGFASVLGNWSLTKGLSCPLTNVSHQMDHTSPPAEFDPQSFHGLAPILASNTDVYTPMPKPYLNIPNFCWTTGAGNADSRVRTSHDKNKFRKMCKYHLK